MTTLELIKSIKEKRMTCKECGGSGWATSTFGASSTVLGSYNHDFCYSCWGSGKIKKNQSFFSL